MSPTHFFCLFASLSSHCLPLVLFPEPSVVCSLIMCILFPEILGQDESYQFCFLGKRYMSWNGSRFGDCFPSFISSQVGSSHISQHLWLLGATPHTKVSSSHLDRLTASTPDYAGHLPFCHWEKTGPRILTFRLGCWKTSSSECWDQNLCLHWQNFSIAPSLFFGKGSVALAGLPSPMQDWAVETIWKSSGSF